MGLKANLAKGTGQSKHNLFFVMFSIYENNEKISGACRSFVLCLDYVAISPFIYFKTSPNKIILWEGIRSKAWGAALLKAVESLSLY